jgi:hypothetical protein
MAMVLGLLVLVHHHEEARQQVVGGLAAGVLQHQLYCRGGVGFCHALGGHPGRQQVVDAVAGHTDGTGPLFSGTEHSGLQS